MEVSRRRPGRQHIRPRWPALTRTTVLLPALVPHPGGTSPRTRTARHLSLVGELSGSRSWSGRALHACLEHLLTSSVTEAARVAVVDAWTDGPDAICIVYRPPHDEARVVGVRRSRRHATEPGEWRIGDTTTWGYETGPDIDPEPFGWNVADFDIGEPLGYVTTVLRYDAADIGWWGDLDTRADARDAASDSAADLPVPPDSE